MPYKLKLIHQIIFIVLSAKASERGNRSSSSNVLSGLRWLLRLFVMVLETLECWRKDTLTLRLLKASDRPTEPSDITNERSPNGKQKTIMWPSEKTVSSQLFELKLMLSFLLFGIQSIRHCFSLSLSWFIFEDRRYFCFCRSRRATREVEQFFMFL